MTSKEKSRFRSTRKWKLFRLFMIKKNDSSCELCGTKYSGVRKRQLQIHHLCPHDYTNLDPSKFKCLCASCHKLVELFTIKKSWGKHEKLWHLLLDDYISIQKSS